MIAAGEIVISEVVIADERNRLRAWDSAASASDIAAPDAAIRNVFSACGKPRNEWIIDASLVLRAYARFGPEGA